MLTAPGRETPRAHASAYTKVLKRYERYAPSYDRRWARYSRATLGAALEMIPPDAGGELLDVACGTGLFEDLLRRERPGLKITGIDVSPQMLEKARERFNGGDGIAWAVGKAEALPVEAGRFDFVTCNNAFHLVQDAPAALAEFRRALRPGGLLAIVDWCADFMQIRMLDLYSRITHHIPRQLRGLDEMAALLRDAGFVLERSQRFKATPFWGMMRFAARRPVGR